MEDDWDLHVVVRGRAALTTTTTTTSSAAASTNTASGGQLFSSSFQQDCNFSAAANNCFQDLFEPPGRERLANQELHELYKPFIFKSSESWQTVIQPQSLPTNSPLGGLQDLTSGHQQIVKQLPQRTQITQKPQPFSYFLENQHEEGLSCRC